MANVGDEKRAAEEGDQATGPGDSLVAGAVGERCSNCGAPLASDQRYCVECGQRRGKPRFPVPGQAKSSATPAPKRRRRRLTGGDFPGATLVAFIACLLLAMGVGVEIGHSNKQTTTTAAASAPQVITVAGGDSNSNSSSAKSGSRKSGSGKKAKASKATKVTKVVVQKQNSAASKALGTSSKNLVQNPGVQQGQSCTGGAGCQNGKFTGNFFGGG